MKKPGSTSHYCKQTTYIKRWLVFLSYVIPKTHNLILRKSRNPCTNFIVVLLFIIYLFIFPFLFYIHLFFPSSWYYLLLILFFLCLSVSILSCFIPFIMPSVSLSSHFTVYLHPFPLTHLSLFPFHSLCTPPFIPIKAKQVHFPFPSEYVAMFPFPLPLHLPFSCHLNIGSGATHAHRHLHTPPLNAHTYTHDWRTVCVILYTYTGVATHSHLRRQNERAEALCYRGDCAGCVWAMRWNHDNPPQQKELLPHSLRAGGVCGQCHLSVWWVLFYCACVKVLLIDFCICICFTIVFF